MASKSLPERFRLDGRHAVVAGGAGLLGPSFCNALMEVGARVTSVDINVDKLRACADRFTPKYGDAFRTVACDLTDEANVEKAIAEAEAVAPLHILVNAAAIDPKTDASATAGANGFSSYPVSAWRKSMDVNLTGTFLVTQAVCRRFERRGSGVVVNISSTYGLVGPDQRIYREGRTAPFAVKPPDYSVSKAGMVGFTRYLAAYYARTGIRVNCLSPGGVFNNHDAAFNEAYSSRTLLGRMADRDDYNGAIVFLCSDASAYMTGANLVVDGGWTAV